MEKSINQEMVEVRKRTEYLLLLGGETFHDSPSWILGMLIAEQQMFINVLSIVQESDVKLTV